jgi:hypothetical protein
MRRDPRPEAGAQRTLEGVGCTAGLGRRIDRTTLVPDRIDDDGDDYEDADEDRLIQKHLGDN